MKQKALFILGILFGLMMVNAGLNKFFNYMPSPPPSEEQMKIFGAMMTLKWLLPLVAIVEIIGGLLIAIPKTQALAALIMLPITVGIVAHHLTFDVSGIGMALVLFLINLWIIFENREKYLPILK